MRALAAALAPAVLVGALYGRAVELWWTWDDAFLIRGAMTHRLHDYVSAAFWRAQPNQHVSPLHQLAVEAALKISTEPAPLYVVQLATMAGFALACYAVLTLWLSHRAALAAVLLFLAGTPLCELATRLSTPQHLHSLTLAAAAIYVHVIGARRESYWMPIASASLYLAALLSKEIAFPLPLVVMLLPERRSTYALALHLYAAVTFLALRTVIFGNALQSYGFALTAGEILPLAFTTPWRALRSVLGPEPLVALALAVVLVVVMAPAMRERRLAIASAAAVMASMVMVFPVAKAFEPRHTLLLWLTLAIVFVIAARERWPWIAAAIGLTLIANRGQWQLEYASSFRQSSEGRAFFALGSGEVLAYPSIPPAAMQELRWLKEVGRREAPADWFYDDIYLCEGRGANRRFVSWRPDSRTVDAITPDPQCGQVKEAPMTAHFRHRRHTLFWSFGPYRDGRWTVIMDGGRQAFAVPAADGFQLPGVRALSMRIRYDSPEGWRTYSPEIGLDFDREPDHSFTR